MLCSKELNINILVYFQKIIEVKLLIFTPLKTNVLKCISINVFTL